MGIILICKVNSKIYHNDDEAISRCVNPSCIAQIKGKIKHFVSKNCMDIDGFGIKLVDQMVDKQLIHSVSDIYKLTLEQLSELDRMAGKSAQNIIDSIEKNSDESQWVYLRAIENAPAASFATDNIRLACKQALNQGLIKVQSSCQNEDDIKKLTLSE